MGEFGKVDISFFLFILFLLFFSFSGPCWISLGLYLPLAVPDGRCIVYGEEVCISLFFSFFCDLVVVTLILVRFPCRGSAGPLCVCVMGQLAGF